MKSCQPDLSTASPDWERIGGKHESPYYGNLTACLIISLELPFLNHLSRITIYIHTLLPFPSYCTWALTLPSRSSSALNRTRSQLSDTGLAHNRSSPFALNSLTPLLVLWLFGATVYRWLIRSGIGFEAGNPEKSSISIFRRRRWSEVTSVKFDSLWSCRKNGMITLSRIETVQWKIRVQVICNESCLFNSYIFDEWDAQERIFQWSASLTPIDEMTVWLKREKYCQLSVEFDRITRYWSIRWNCGSLSNGMTLLLNKWYQGFPLLALCSGLSLPQGFPLLALCSGLSLPLALHARLALVKGCGPNKERVGRVPILVVSLATREDYVVGDEAANSV